MAGYQAIRVTLETIRRFLEVSVPPELGNDAVAAEDDTFTVRIFDTRDFEDGITRGVSLFLYRVTVCGTQRPPPPKPGRRPDVLVELLILMTAWALDASLEQEILGWLMRAIEDNAVLSSGVLNAQNPGVFDVDETVELVPGQLSNEELFRIWDVLPSDYQVSVPYVARVLRIRSEINVQEAGPVLRRDLEFGVLRDP